MQSIETGNFRRHCLMPGREWLRFCMSWNVSWVSTKTWHEQRARMKIKRESRSQAKCDTFASANEVVWAISKMIFDEFFKSLASTKSGKVFIFMKSILSNTFCSNFPLNTQLSQLGNCHGWLCAKLFKSKFSPHTHLHHQCVSQQSRSTKIAYKPEEIWHKNNASELINLIRQRKLTRWKVAESKRKKIYQNHSLFTIQGAFAIVKTSQVCSESIVLKRATRSLTTERKTVCKVAFVYRTRLHRCLHCLLNG